VIGFDWLVAIFFSFFAICCLVGAYGFLKDYEGWIAKVFGLAYVAIGIGLFVVGFSFHNGAGWHDDWWVRLMMPAVLGFCIWSELEKRGKVTYLGLRKDHGGEKPPT
jgi:hypothetical protein